MVWLPVVIVVLLLLVGLWAFVAAAPESSESAGRARQHAQNAAAAKRLAEAYDEGAPLVLVLARAPSPTLLEWARASAPLDAPRAIDVHSGQDLLDLLVAATGEDLPRATAREADADAHRAATFAARQHPIAGRVDLLEHAALKAVTLPALERWLGAGRRELAEALLEFEGASELDLAKVELALESGLSTKDAPATLEAAALVRPLLEAARDAVAAGASLALVWVPAAEQVDVARAAVASPPPAPPPDAPPSDLVELTDRVLAVLGEELEARGVRAARDPDGGRSIEGAPLRVRAWPYAQEARGQAHAVSIAIELEATLERERGTYRFGFTAVAPTIEHATRLAVSSGVAVAVPPFVEACAAPDEDVPLWSPPLRSDRPAAYEVHAGRLRLDGRPSPELLEALTDRPVFMLLRDAFEARAARRVHVLDLRAGRRAGVFDGECRLDGAPWTDWPAEAFAALPWPDDAPLVGVRAVIVLRAARR